MKCSRCPADMIDIQGSAYVCESCGYSHVVDRLAIKRTGVGTRLADKIPSWMPKPRGVTARDRQLGLITSACLAQKRSSI